MAATNESFGDTFTSIAQPGIAISESEFDPERTISVDFTNNGDTSNNNCGICGEGSGRKLLDGSNVINFKPGSIYFMCWG